MSSSNSLSVCRVHCRPWECQSCGATAWEARFWNAPQPTPVRQKQDLVHCCFLFTTDKPCLQCVFQKSCHIETLTFGKRQLHPELLPHLHMSVPDLRYLNNRVWWVNTNKVWFNMPSLLTVNICDFHKWITTVDHKELEKRKCKNAKLHEITQLNNKQQSYHRASLCSISLRKPVWNLCKGSKLEKMRFFSASGMQSSLFTALWNHYKEQRSKIIRSGMQQVWSFAVFVQWTQINQTQARTLFSWH